MTRTLNAAIAQLAALPPDEQIVLAAGCFRNLRTTQWTRKFDISQDLLGKLAAETRTDRTGGRVTDVDPDRL
jgi:hypothetical protein